MPTPPVFDIVDTYRGDTWLLTMPIYKAAPRENPDDPIEPDLEDLPDFTGYSVRMQVRPDPDAKRKFLDVSTDTGEITFTDNVLRVAVPAELMEQLPPINAYYDIEFTDTNDVVTTYLRGRFNVVPDTTRF